MSQENNKKQSRRENKNTYVVNPEKSADPPQPQGKTYSRETGKNKNINMK